MLPWLQARRWRHLDTMLFTPSIEAAVPGAQCRMEKPPAADDGSWPECSAFLSILQEFFIIG